MLSLSSFVKVIGASGGDDHVTADMNPHPDRSVRVLYGAVFHLQYVSRHDGPDTRTTVFLKGCPLRSLWCHNTVYIADSCCTKVCPANAYWMTRSRGDYDWSVEALPRGGLGESKLERFDLTDPIEVRLQTPSNEEAARSGFRDTRVPLTGRLDTE